jgi:hypothetical protein
VSPLANSITCPVAPAAKCTTKDEKAPRLTQKKSHKEFGVTLALGMQNKVRVNRNGSGSGSHANGQSVLREQFLSRGLLSNPR